MIKTVGAQLVFQSQLIVKLVKLINKNGIDRMLTLAEPYRNQSELVKDVDFRVVNDLYVFSKWYHIKRGECCGNDCQNCPY